MDGMKTYVRINQLLEVVVNEIRSIGIIPSDKISRRVLIAEKGRFFGRCSREKSTGRFTIILHKAMLEADEHYVKETLAHEVLHTVDGCFNHSPMWKSYARYVTLQLKYSITTTATAAEKGITDEMLIKVNYVVKCNSCGKESKFQRLSKVVKHPELYRCKCGGTLRRVK